MVSNLTSSSRPRSAIPRLFKLLSVLLTGSLIAAACSGGGDEQTVTIYSGRTENLIGPILADFAAETGISVRVKYAQSADLALTIFEEGDKTPADVFLSQSPGAVGFLENASMLAPIPSDVLELVPEAVRDSEGRWIGFSGRKRVLVYNPDLVSEDELPDSVFDLTDPEWAGRVAVAPPNGSFQDFVSAMRATEGDDATKAWLAGLVANDAQTFPNNNSIVAAVGRGEIAIGLVNHYYNYRFQTEDPDHNGLNHHMADGDPGSILIITGAAIIEGSEHSDEAAELIRWLLGESAQRYFADETYEYPLSPGIPTATGVPAASFSEVGGIDYSTMGGDLASTRTMIADVGLEG